jgi:hypothetical protein
VRSSGEAIELKIYVNLREIYNINGRSFKFKQQKTARSFFLR